MRRLFGAALLAGAGVAHAAGADALSVRGPDGAEVGRIAVAPGDEVCLRWSHSVTGGAVADCFEIRDGRLILARSYLHDFAAGLGHLPGRGVQRAAEGGGYWIEEMAEPVPGDTLPLRVGRPEVGHRLTSGDRTLDLSARVAGDRVTLTPVTP